MRELSFILPQWPAPAQVRAAVTTRAGGTSRGAYASLNLGENTNDDPVAVAANRRLLRARLGLAREPVWLRQVHGAFVLRADAVAEPAEADASWTDQPDVVCAILTADCLPVLFCDRAGTRVAAVHGGWRGLAAGILENTLRAFDRPAREVLAWLGPAIGPAAFEVGPEVHAAFVRRWPDTETAFRPGRGDRRFCDIYAIARIQLHALGVTDISGGGFCTVNEPERFFSWRRDGQNNGQDNGQSNDNTGRMASLVWLTNP